MNSPKPPPIILTPGLKVTLPGKLGHVIFPNIDLRTEEVKKSHRQGITLFLMSFIDIIETSVISGDPTSLGTGLGELATKVKFELPSIKELFTVIMHKIVEGANEENDLAKKAGMIIAGDVIANVYNQIFEEEKIKVDQTKLIG